MRRYEEFKRHESVKLVKEYLTCTDELTSIVQVLKGKVSMLTQLLKNVEKDEQEERQNLLEELSDREPGNLDSARDRIQWALSIVEDQDRAFKSLLDDLRLATEAVSDYFFSKSFTTSLIRSALSTALHRTKRTRNSSRQSKQSHPRIHRRHHCLSTLVILYRLLRYESQRCSGYR